MRHTVTLDDDVEAIVEKERETTGKGFKAVVNDLIREAHQRRELGASRQRPPRYELKPLSVGRIRHEVVGVGEALEIAEGDDYR